MSLHSIIHHELTPGASSHAAPSVTPPRNADSTRESLERLGRLRDNEQPQAHHTPVTPTEEIQRVFNVAPLNVTNKNRRLAITTLIVVCNLMQMICNLIGIAGGLEISQRLGVSGVHANWVGASYPYVILRITFCKFGGC